MGRMPRGLNHCGAEEAKGAEARVGRVGGVPVLRLILRGLNRGGADRADAAESRVGWVGAYRLWAACPGV